MKKRLCPLCGKNNTASILWGTPFFNKELEELLNNKEVILGGCSVPVDKALPSHFCFNCNKDILFNFERELRIVTSFEFEIGGIHQGHRSTKVHKNNDRFYITTLEFYDKNEVQTTEEEYFRILKKFFRARVLEWNKRYCNNNILDGEQWNIKIKFSEKSSFDNKKSFETYGSNDYPPFWKKFLKAIKSIENSIS